jgi:multiple sugar transport system ATP-binding protein
VATLTLQEVSKTYDNGVDAVRSVDLFVDDGEFVVLVGPSGCGKTTILRMVAGLEDVTDGEILLDGKVVTDASPRERDVAMVFQNYALYPHLSVQQNIAFSLSMRHVAKAEQERRVQEAAALLGLTDLLSAKPRQLSGGQRQRVAMGRALVREPAVFLMDEPLSNLDARLRVQMRTEVMHIQRRVAVATLYVTHDQTEAMTMGDRVAVVRDGTLQQVAPPREIYSHPANLFVAAFMGSPSMNLYEASLSAGADALQLGSQRLAIPETARRALPALNEYGGREVVVGIRPEHLSIATGDSAAGDGNTLQCDVQLVEELGNELLVHFTSDMKLAYDEPLGGVDEDEPAGSIASGTGVARVDPRLSIRSGERITLAVDMAQIRFFDPQSGQALATADVAAAAVPS